MTISNSNLQSLLSVSPEMSADSAAGLQTAAAGIIGEQQDEALNEGEFWSMLSQQLTEITAQNDTQVIENKQLLSIFNEFESDLEMIDDGAELPARWMQIMAAPLAEDAGLEPTGLISELIASGDASDSVALVTAANLTDSKAVTAAASGNNLPHMRQLASAMLPTVATGHGAAVDASISDSALSERMPDADAKLMDIRLASDTEFKASDINIEKILMKQGAVEQQAATAPKDAGLTGVLHLSPLSTTAPQTLSSAQLPSPLQTLQLSPQSAAGEWGNALGERVSFLINHKLERAEIRIDPPHLGKLDIQIQLKDDSATVVINTQHAQTRDLIDSASFRLREFLQEAGYSSVDVNVSHQQASTSEQGFDGQGQNDVSGETDPDDAPTSGATPDGQSVAMTMAVDDGRIDYFA